MAVGFWGLGGARLGGEKGELGLFFQVDWPFVTGCCFGGVSPT